MLKVARIIADLAAFGKVVGDHVSEAIQLRSLAALTLALDQNQTIYYTLFAELLSKYD